MRHFLSIFTIVLIYAISIDAQTPADICRVTTSYMSISQKIGSGIIELGAVPLKDETPYVSGEFRPTTFQDETVKTFKDDKTGIFVGVKIEYGDDRAVEKGKPVYIKLSISVSDKEQDALRFSEGLTSQTTYGKRWGSLSIERLFTADDLVHTFRLSCNDGRKEWQPYFGKKQKS